jgi:hypothetical protein
MLRRNQSPPQIFHEKHTREERNMANTPALIRDRATVVGGYVGSLDSAVGATFSALGLAEPSTSSPIGGEVSRCSLLEDSSKGDIMQELRETKFILAAAKRAVRTM